CSNGLISGTPTAANTFNFTLTATDAVGASGSAPLQMVVNPALNVTTVSPLPAWTQGKSGYSQTMAATGGTGAQTWSVTGGIYPTGMTAMTAGGLIAGTPSAANTFTFTATVTDSVGATGSKSMSITINPSIAITTTSPLADGEENVAYSKQFLATGGTGAINWRQSGGTGIPP